MSSFEPRGGATAGVRFLPLSGPAVEDGAPPVSSVFTELVQSSLRPLGAPTGALFEGTVAASGGSMEEPGAEESNARESAEALASLEAALHAAYERGLHAGREALEAEYGAVAQGFAEALGELVKTSTETRTRHHRALLGVAFGAARKIVHEELELSQERWLTMIRDGVHRTLDRETIRVRVGASLHHYLAGHLNELRGLLEEVRDLELIEDLGLPATGCVIETAYGDLDLSADSQLSSLQAALSEPT